ERRSGVGLTSMRERTAELGGVCLVSGGPGEGTTVEVVLPLSAPLPTAISAPLPTAPSSPLPTAPSSAGSNGREEAQPRPV
ncbi:hypothetical protein ACFQ08_21900, partial [Streptosporangium algeriense]